MTLLRNAVMFFGLVLAFEMNASYAQQTRSSSNYPERPIRFIVPFPPGSGTDTSARYFGKKLGDLTGQPVPRRTPHQGQRVLHVLFGEDAQERRLPQSNREGLL